MKEENNHGMFFQHKAILKSYLIKNSNLVFQGTGKVAFGVCGI
jgi:hypothetical protein